MASPRAIAAVLAYLHELYPTREISATTSEAWAMTFAAWDDETLTAAARAAAATPGRVFFPTPGELAALRPAPVIDGDAVLRQIERLSTYSPHTGMIAPRVEQVRDALGDAVATAYGMGGGARLFSVNEVTRDIARRDFHHELVALARTGTTLPQLSAGNSSVLTPSMAPRFTRGEAA